MTLSFPEQLTRATWSRSSARWPPRPLRLEGLVDGRNQRVAADALAKTLESALQAYRAADKRDQLSAMSEPNLS